MTMTNNEKIATYASEIADLVKGIKASKYLERPQLTSANRILKLCEKLRNSAMG